MNDYTIFPATKTNLVSQQADHLYIEDIVESFLTDRIVSGCTDKTVRFYRPYLRGICEYLAAQQIVDLAQVSGDTIRKYLLLLQQTHNPGGLHAAFRSFRAFFRWVEFEELMPQEWKNPIKKVRAPKVPQKIIQPIQLAEVASLLKTCSELMPVNLRDKAIILVLLDTGIRAQELCNLNLADVDLTSGRVAIKLGKGQKDRVCFINPEVIDAVHSYINTRFDREQPLFLSTRNHRLSYDGLRQMLERRIKAANLNESRSLHDFRRAFAINMLRKKVDIYALQRLMGHSDLTVLRRYLDLNEDDIEAAHNQGSPVDSLLDHEKSAEKEQQHE